MRWGLVACVRSASVRRDGRCEGRLRASPPAWPRRGGWATSAPMPRLTARLNACLAWVLAGLLLWHSNYAPMHCLRVAAASASIEICGAHGLQRLQLNSDQAPAPEGGCDACLCAVCHALPEVLLTTPVGLPSLAWTLLPRPPLPRTAAGLRPGARAPPYAPTGPPRLV